MAGESHCQWGTLGLEDGESLPSSQSNLSQLAVLIAATRICIGRNLAENSLVIVLALVLATVDIGWPLGPDGEPTPFEPEWSFRGQA